MNLPKELKNIIMDYKEQLDYVDKKKKVMEQLINIPYEIEYDSYHGIYRGIRLFTHYFYYNDQFNIENYCGRSQIITITENTKYIFSYW